MMLRFIGEDGSLGLEHGEVYEVKVFSREKWIWVSWKPCPPFPTSGEPHNSCPYSSPLAFANNWESVE